MYFHRWSHLFDVTILLLCPGVAIFVHAMIERRRIGPPRRERGLPAARAVATCCAGSRTADALNVASRSTRYASPRRSGPSTIRHSDATSRSLPQTHRELHAEVREQDRQVAHVHVAVGIEIALVGFGIGCAEIGQQRRKVRQIHVAIAVEIAG